MNNKIKRNIWLIKKECEIGNERQIENEKKIENEKESRDKKREKEGETCREQCLKIWFDKVWLEFEMLQPDIW